MSYKSFRKNEPLSFQLMWPSFSINRKHKELFIDFPITLRIVIRPINKPCYLFGFQIVGFGFGIVYEPGYRPKNLVEGA